jgi:anti-anti-sigma factor
VTVLADRARVSVEGTGARAVCRVTGELDLTTAPRLTVAGREALRGGASELVVDLTEVVLASSATIRALLNLQRTALRRHATLEVVCRPGTVLELFRITRTEAALNVTVESWRSTGATSASPTRTRSSSPSAATPSAA